jgi:hypothetical protein
MTVPAVVGWATMANPNLEGRFWEMSVQPPSGLVER